MSREGCSTPLTISQAGDHFAGTGLTKTAIRRALIAGLIPHVRVGSKYLVTLENIEKWLQGGGEMQNGDARPGA